MKDLLEMVFRNLRTYVPVLAALVARPKMTIAKHVTGDERVSLVKTSSTKPQGERC